MSFVPQSVDPAAQAVPDLLFQVQGAEAERYSAAPALNFALGIERAGGGPVRSILLDTQIQIAARRRPYGEAEQASLVELFGTPDRWGTTLRTLLWTRTTLVVPPFSDVAEVNLPVACSYDLEANACNYLSGLRDGEVPLEFLFSGSVFYSGPGGMLQTARISWDREAEYRLPVRVWREAMDRHFPGSAWVRLGRPAFDGLRAYKAEHGLRTLEDAVERLLGGGRMNFDAIVRGVDAARRDSDGARRDSDGARRNSDTIRGGGCAMRQSPPQDPVRRIADAVLYEGYLLWPYRKSALKNQQRFTFGGVYPPSWEQDRCAVQTQALLQGGEDARVEVRVRFLHVVRRQVLKIDSPGDRPEPVEELIVGSERHLSWEEAVERELAPGPIDIAAGCELQEIAGGAIERSWRALAGEVSLTCEPIGSGLSRLTVRVQNTAPWPGGPRDEALRQTLCSAHVVMRAGDGGEWVSLTDPPAELRTQAQACENVGLWPVLVGEPGDRATLLASPIILSDHPEIAPESPGDLFDSGEIDQMLVLNILAMTDEEREAMRDCDPRAKEILQRTEALSDEEIMRLNGAVREFGLVRAR